MQIRHWMTPTVITVTPDTSLLKAGKLMRENNVRRLPVVDKDGRVVGIVSDRDVRDASPSKATTLDTYELRYLLAELKVSQIMSKNPVVISPDDTVEKAAMIMLDHKIGGLPVVNAENRIEGIISEQDVFKVLVDITGIREPGFQIGFAIENRQGAMKPVFDLIRRRGGRILSVLTDNNREEERKIFIRLRSMANAEEEAALVEELREHCDVAYWTNS